MVARNMQISIFSSEEDFGLHYFCWLHQKKTFYFTLDALNFGIKTIVIEFWNKNHCQK